MGFFKNKRGISLFPLIALCALLASAALFSIPASAQPADGDEQTAPNPDMSNLPPPMPPDSSEPPSDSPEVPPMDAASIPKPIIAAASGQEPIATLIFKGGSLSTILAQLKKQTGVNVVPRGAKIMDLKMDLVAQKEPVSQILQKIASSNNLYLHQSDPANWELMDEKTYKTEFLPKQVIRKIFVLKYIKAEEARKALENVKTKDIGQMAADPRTNKLIVTDLPQVVELIKRMLDEIDVQLMTRVFYIRHADVGDIADKIQNYKSAPGTIDVDAKSHQIIVSDIFQNIKRMEMLIELLDVGPELRIYDLNNIGTGGKGADELSKAIEQVITKNADVFWQIDEKSGTLIVQDVPEVHERIEQILAALDRPIKQVLIYAELIDTNFNKTYDLGINWDASEDFFSAVRDNLFAGAEGTNRIPTGTSGDLTKNLGFLNLDEEFPVFTMDGSSLAVGYLNKYFRATLKTALSRSDTKVLLQPRMIVKNQEEASVKVGGNKPYRTTNYYTDNRWQSSGQSTVHYGLDVTLKPTISNTGLIEMEINFTNSDASFVGDPTKDPLVETTEVVAKTKLIIPTGETRVIAGMLNNNKTETRGGIPLLSELPIVGPLFGAYNQKDGTRNILFFITPTIIEEKPNKKDHYRGKSIDELMEAGAALPAYIEDLTSQTLAASPKKSEMETEGEPALQSDMPIELKRLLKDSSNLDAQNLRQQRQDALAGPSGTFTDTTTAVAARPAPSAEASGRPPITAITPPVGKEGETAPPPPPRPSEEELRRFESDRPRKPVSPGDTETKY
ncbi:MAG TPA: secretin N-terminal domain-containing protein [Candidatus Sumerlaeota bacterium]|nr:secretin N-terminal domain-containing protein [Candidatus Sumerlaeota bacterium]HON49813.1 secretin N-terminal domain-containing protein [Candidatus Sumerlaeota bacterium]HOR63939.1 secretin N-terminal domain-containing protein [Candidatus Sumerlaeota bacterium]HPL75087.1 secretin N-terminal domain-containing protein [Candidatus Sumerlaeota bacterium]HRU53702.1 secretin N-terminal domain-containing protein [Candidatus Sumerlaeia bacterium]